MGDLGWRGRSSKVRGKSKEAGTRTLSQVNPSFWGKKLVNGCLQESYRIMLSRKRNSFYQEKKSIPIVKGRERGGVWVHLRIIEERVY